MARLYNVHTVENFRSGGVETSGAGGCCCAALADDEEGLVAQGCGESDVAKVERTAPTGDVVFVQGIEYVAEHGRLRFVVFIGIFAGQSVQLVVVVIDNFGLCLEKGLTLADEMLAAASFRTLHCGRSNRLFRIGFLQLFPFALTPFYGGDNEQC